MGLTLVTYSAWPCLHIGVLCMSEFGQCPRGSLYIREVLRIAHCAVAIPSFYFSFRVLSQFSVETHTSDNTRGNHSVQAGRLWLSVNVKGATGCTLAISGL